ncbi:MAG: ATPase, T2SS/T4P/T4SS family [bacterium]
MSKQQDDFLRVHQLSVYQESFLFYKKILLFMIIVIQNVDKQIETYILNNIYFLPVIEYENVWRLMNNDAKPLILCIDDDKYCCKLEELFLKKAGYEVIGADNGSAALTLINDIKPDLILLDVMMPGMTGYEVCLKLQEDEKTAYIPVIFVTALGEDIDKIRAFSAGAADYIVKPIREETLIPKINAHIKTKTKWNEFRKESGQKQVNIMPSDFLTFKESLVDKFGRSAEMENKFSEISSQKLYGMASYLGIKTNTIAKHVADFLHMTYIPHINPDDLLLGVFPAPFSKKNSVIAITSISRKPTFVLSNPFNWELMEILKKHADEENDIQFCITEPENIDSLFDTHKAESEQGEKKMPENKEKSAAMLYNAKMISALGEKNDSIIGIADGIIESAVTERASDIHIEPKKTGTTIRFRIDGDMREFSTLEKEIGIKVIARFKALGGFKITEKRKPQDGVLEMVVDNRSFRLRLATTLTGDGESLIIRIVEPMAKPTPLQELGMTKMQSEILIESSNRNQGLILMVGPTGSGKTTTIYSLLSQIDCKKGSLISIEDPIEYRIHFANQQQVNEKAGLTFDSLLKSSVRQDPDILYIGEIRDQYSANIAMDFSSTGHLTISSLHTSNAITAIFRLERLGIGRGTIADTLLCVIGQRLVKKLCPHCKKIVPLSEEEKNLLATFSSEIPTQVAHPVGCSKCNNTGYYGREGVYEVIKFDSEIRRMIRSGMSVLEIRRSAHKRGYYLNIQHAMEKIKNLVCDPKQIYEKILVEEEGFNGGAEPAQEISTIEAPQTPANRILIVDDDEKIQKLMCHILTLNGYEVTSAEDGIAALMLLGKTDFDLIITDLNMPHLDGFTLIELLSQKGITTPIVFLTGSNEEKDEVRGFELGAVDFIKKPIKKEVLLLRVKNVLKKHI